MRDRSIAEVVRQLELALPGTDGERSCVVPSAIVQAGARLGPDPIAWLFRCTGPEWGIRSAEADRWRGLSLFAVDGTTLRVPDSDENRQHFGSQKRGKRGPTAYPQVRLVTLMAVRSHLLVDASFGPYGIDERRYASQLWASVPDNALVLIDRGFLQANILVPLQTSGTNRNWLTRAKSTSKWTVLQRGPTQRSDAAVVVSSTSHPI